MVLIALNQLGEGERLDLFLLDLVDDAHFGGDDQLPGRNRYICSRLLDRSASPVKYRARETAGRADGLDLAQAYARGSRQLLRLGAGILYRSLARLRDGVIFLFHVELDPIDRVRASTHFPVQH